MSAKVSGRSCSKLPSRIYVMQWMSKRISIYGLVDPRTLYLPIHYASIATIQLLGGSFFYAIAVNCDIHLLSKTVDQELSEEMGNRDMSNQFMISGLHQHASNHPPVEQYIPMVRTVATDNRHLVAPMDHTLRGGSNSHWNFGGSYNEHHPSFVSMEAPQVPPFSGPPVDPYTHSSTSGNTSVAPMGPVGHFHPSHYYDPGMGHIPAGNGGPFKRKSTSLSEGSSSNFYDGGSSSSSQMLIQKPDVDGLGLPPFRGSSISIDRQSSMRNVRSRSIPELEPCMTRTNVPSYGSHFYQPTTHFANYPVPVHPVNLTADVMSQGWNSVPYAASHGWTAPPGKALEVMVNEVMSYPDREGGFGIAYAPQVGLSEEEKKAFWDSLDEVVRESSTDQRLILEGDLNGHIGATTEGYSGVHGGFGYGVRNEEGGYGVRRANNPVENLNGVRGGGNATTGFLPHGEALGPRRHIRLVGNLGGCVKRCNLKSRISKQGLESYFRARKKLDSKEGANEIFRIVKARQRRRRDLGDICFIKDEGGRTVTDEEEIKKRWGEYFSSLFNTGEPEGHEGIVDQNTLPLIDYYYSRISQTKVRTAVQKMGRNKAVGPDQIPIEAWRSLGAEGISWLTSLFNKIFISAKMPEEWRLSDVIHIFKNKGNAQVCSNYRGIKLLSYTIKLWERVIERMLRRETSVSENQFGFMPGRSSIEAIHLIRSLMEKYWGRQRDVHLAFIDLEKVYDSVPRDVIWKTLIDKGASRRYIKVIRDMYNGAKTRVRTSIGNTEFFSVEEDIPWCMIFADDIMLVSESAKGLNDRLENWREALEANGLRVSREKTEYLRCDFSNSEIAHNKEVEVCIGDKILQPKESFRYLGSMLHKSGRIDEDVAHRIKGSGGRQHESFVIEIVPLNLKGKFYRSAIRPLCCIGVVYGNTDINGLRRETNQFNAGGSSVDINAGHRNPFFQGNLASSSQGPHVSRVQFTEDACNYNSGSISVYRNGPPSHCNYTNGSSSSTNELHFPSEAISTRYSSHSRAGGWDNGYRNGRPRMDFPRFPPIVDVMGSHDRLGRETLAADQLSFYHNSMNFPDQYQDMRLDIDDMSYEELLALEERIGNVSTGLSEEGIFECLSEQVYCSVDRIHEAASCPICLIVDRDGKMID
ncbi:retrovirus-related pol polyprotein LINE-1 [Tanacetum coccineum]